MKLHSLLKYRYFALLLGIFTLFATYLLFYNLENRQVIGSDGIGYYSYLPAIFIDNDLSFTKVVNRYEQKLNTSAPKAGECIPGNALCDEFVCMKPQPDGRYINKYPVGEAIIFLPFFTGADIYVQLTNGIRDGISPPYQIAVALAGLVFLQLGTYVTYLVLKKRFTRPLTFILLILLLAGTNLVHYAIYEPAMSHIYSFTMITLAIYLMDRYLSSPSKKLLILLSLNLSFIALLRNLNLAFSIIPLLTIILNSPVKTRLKTALEILLYMTLSVLFIFIPQFLYWEYSTGSLIAYGYQNESFNFLDPHLLSVLFDLKYNGLFFWHPLLLFIIPGSYYWLKSKDKISRISLLYLLVFLYVISSWWAYWFGYSFGHRAFTDYYILFLIPIGYFIMNLKDKKRIVKVGVGILMVFFVYLNLVQMNNYWRGIVSSFNYSWDNYWSNFLNPHLDRIMQIGRLFD